MNGVDLTVRVFTMNQTFLRPGLQTDQKSLFCVNRSNGKIVWSKDLVADFDGV
jgi:hypothetical protein